MAVDEIELSVTLSNLGSAGPADTVEADVQRRDKNGPITLPVETWLTKGTYVWTLEHNLRLLRSLWIPTTCFPMTTAVTTS